jgi:hypothetical protein
MRASEFLTEAVSGSVGRQYQHIEDLVFTNGAHGGLHAIERLADMNRESNTIELKWDGMPVIYWGRDENGVFSMMPKNAWAYLKRGTQQTAQGVSTVMRSPKDVKNFIMGTGRADPNDKERLQFATNVANLWSLFEKASPESGYLEGGLLFYSGHMPEHNVKNGTYDFTPNITKFQVPMKSELGQKISKAKAMVAATGFYATLGSDNEQRYNNADALSTNQLIVQGTTYVEQGPNMDIKGLQQAQKYISKNAALIDNYLKPKPGVSNPASVLYKFYNTVLRNPSAASQFVNWAKDNLSEGQMNALVADKKGLSAVLTAVDLITVEKLKMISILSQGTHGGIHQANPEGYVQAHPGREFTHDLPGQFIKAIDQANWSPRKL